MVSSTATAPSVHEDEEDVSICDADRDSLHVLPLSVLPVQTRAVARARMIKNARLESVIELFDDVDTGSGQIRIEDLPRNFDWPSSPPHPDLLLLRQVGTLASYDVFSLRVTLRERGIAVNDVDGLKLSEHKTRQLTSYMTSFTRPLIKEIYGNDDVSLQTLDDILGLFRSPDITEALKKLKQMAEFLGVDVTDIPRFLENQGDIFLSVSYYRQCLDEIMPSVEKLVNDLDALEARPRLQQDPGLVKTCRMMRAKINELTAAISGCLENFERSTRDIWHDLSPERFSNVDWLVRNYHTRIGGALCLLSVKVDSWVRHFPENGKGSLNARARFVNSEMKQGFERIEELELSPMLTTLR